LRSLQLWSGINECECSQRVVTIGPSELNCERNALTIADQMTLAAQLGPISGIRSCLRDGKRRAGSAVVYE